MIQYARVAVLPGSGMKDMRSRRKHAKSNWESLESDLERLGNRQTAEQNTGGAKGLRKNQ